LSKESKFVFPPKYTAITALQMQYSSTLKTLAIFRKTNGIYNAISNYTAFVHSTKKVVKSVVTPIRC